MNARSFDARHLDVAAFAQQAGELTGTLPLAKLKRLSDFASPEAPSDGSSQMVWHAQGESRTVRAQPPQVWMHLQAHGTLAMTCQRCLQPLSVLLEVERDLRFIEGEEAAAAEDAQSEDDILASTASLNLHTLIEDELVLALPWVPRHEVCPSPLPLPAPDEDFAQAPEHPFAALAQLKKRLDS